MLLRSAAWAAALVLFGQGAVQAAEPGKPLRSLTFSVDYTVQFTATVKNAGGLGMAGIEGSPDAAGRLPPPSQHTGFSGTDPGTLRVDVIAATGDGGLVVDAAYSGQVTKQAPIRVAIYPDGRLAYDPKATLCEEAGLVLPVLARGLVAGRMIAAGATWTMPAPSPLSGTTTYRVAGVDGPRATLSVASAFNVTGPRPYEQREDGTLVYATDVLAPIRWDVTTHMRRHTMGGDEASDGRLTATLIADTFAKT